MSAIPSPDEFIAAAARVAPGDLSATARATLRTYAAQYPLAERLLALDEKARYDAAGPLPRVNPFTPNDLLDAYRRYRQANWPRRLGGSTTHPPLIQVTSFNPNFYALVSEEVFKSALLRLSLDQAQGAQVIERLSVSRTAMGGYEYQHPDKAALGEALIALGEILWQLVRMQYQKEKL